MKNLQRKTCMSQNNIPGKLLFLLVVLSLFITFSASAKSMRPPENVDTQPPARPIDARGEEWQFFKINAQYRGTVKKSFSNLGCAVAWFKDTAPDQTQVIIHVCALHPEKKRQVYAFRLNMLFVHKNGPAGVQYTLLKKEYAEFTGITGSNQEQLQQLAALWAYMRAYAGGRSFQPQVEACGAKLKLSEVLLGKGRSREVDCSWPSRRGFHGKFFFERAVDPVFKEILALDKLRFRSGRLSVSLVKDTQENVTKMFSTHEPFATQVFK